MMNEMYIFRYNPVFQQWVLLGEPVPHNVLLTPAHRLDADPGKRSDFWAASFPGQPFLMEETAHKAKKDDELLYAPQPPIGEYELLVYTGKREFSDWTKREWTEWLMLLSNRLQQMHLNPYVHYGTVRLHTTSLHTLKEGLRVGDCIAASHPLAGMSQTIDPDLIERLLDKEKLFVLHRDSISALYVPSAPTRRRELWLLPQTEGLLDKGEDTHRQKLGATLAHLFSSLHQEYPQEHWVLALHMSFASGDSGFQWWVQIYQDDQNQPLSPLVVQPFPERFVLTLKHLLAHQRATK